MVEPYLSFCGEANEAIEFYEKVFNGKDKKIMRYKDMPANPNFPIDYAAKELVLHAEMIIDGTKINFSDTQSNAVPGNMISLAIQFKTAQEVIDAFNSLKDGGEVLMEVGPQFFSPMYGWVKDKYGVGWQLIHTK